MCSCWLTWRCTTIFARAVQISMWRMFNLLCHDGMTTTIATTAAATCLAVYGCVYIHCYITGSLFSMCTPCLYYIISFTSNVLPCGCLDRCTCPAAHALLLCIYVYILCVRSIWNVYLYWWLTAERCYHWRSSSVVNVWL
jgi:hypothetical protein